MNAMMRLCLLAVLVISLAGTDSARAEVKKTDKIGDRTILPIHVPEQPRYTELDARNASPPRDLLLRHPTKPLMC